MFAEVLQNSLCIACIIIVDSLVVYQLDVCQCGLVLLFQGPGDDEDAEYLPFMKQPFCIYKGHTADLLDVSWSKV